MLHEASIWVKKDGMLQKKGSKYLLFYLEGRKIYKNPRENLIGLFTALFPQVPK